MDLLQVLLRLFPWRHPNPDLLSHGAAAGYKPLREAIARYLREVRALDCTADQVIITSGAQQALDLTVRILLDPGDQVWLEEPGYSGLRGPLVANGAEIVPVPVDAEGLSVEAGCAKARDARLAVVSPSTICDQSIDANRPPSRMAAVSTVDAWVARPISAIPNARVSSHVAVLEQIQGDAAGETVGELKAQARYR